MGWLAASRVAVSATMLGLAACSGPTSSDTRQLVGSIESLSDDMLELTLCTDTGELAVVVLDPDTAYGFHPAHLVDHQRTGEPVSIEVQMFEGRDRAVAIHDVTNLSRLSC